MRNARKAAVVLAVAATGLLLVSPIRRHGFLPAIGQSASAQAAPDALIHLKSLPEKDQSEHGWRHFEITLPPTSPPLDMHVVWLIDGKGTDLRYEEPKAWSQPIPLKFRLDSDDDFRVKAILKAQGLPVKEQIVTYRFSIDALDTLSFYESLKFAHDSGAGSWSGYNDSQAAKIGDKIILSDEALADSKFVGNSRDWQDHWQEPGYVAKFPPGQLHRMTIYVQFRPHTGPVLTAPRGSGTTIQETL
jgi:hypothetical protein